MDREQMIEGVAQAIYHAEGPRYRRPAWGDCDKFSKDIYRDLARAALAALEAAGVVMVPREPTEELLVSMAVRQDHGLGVPGYYDQPLLTKRAGVTHDQRLQSAMSNMRKVHEEVVGTGFYSPENKERYTAMLAARPK